MMATYRITAPDGATYEVTAPEDATQEQVLEYAKQNYRKAAAGSTGREPTSKSSGVSVSESTLRGLYDPFTGAAQVLYNLLPRGVQRAGDRLNDFVADKTGLTPRIGADGFNSAIAQNEADYQQRRSGGIDWGRIAGNVMSPVNTAIALKAPQASGLAQRIVQGSGIGATQAMTQPVTQGDFVQEKIRQGNIGAAVGGAIPIVAGGVARVVSPKASINLDVKMLKEAGVQPTIGQALGGRANVAEQKATSLFGVGESIRTAREGARDQFNKAVLNDAVKSVGGKVDAVGREGVKQAGDIISSAYDDAIAGLKGVSLDQRGISELNNLRSMAGNLPGSTRNQFDRIMNNLVMQRLSPSGGMTAETFKIIESDLGRKAATYGKSMQASERELGDALLEAQRILRDQAARQNPEYAQALAKANEAWAKLVRIEGAAKASTVADGVFTPGQLLGAIKSNSGATRARDFSRGTGLGQRFAEAGQRVLGNTYPDSGTAGRLMPFIQGGAAVANAPVAIGATLAGMGAYTPAIQRALVNAATNRGLLAPFAAEEIRKLAPVLNPLGIGLLNGGQ